MREPDMAMSEVEKIVGIASDVPGYVDCLLGNEAIARGLIEAGVLVVASYPGTPSSEITDTVARVAGELGIYVQWSANEKVAVEVAAAASMAGLRAVVPMKSQGLNVAQDFVLPFALSGTGKGGMLLIFCDDPAGISSTDEQDTRWVARMADLPLLEPGSIQEAKDMAKWALTLSEEVGALVLLRSVTRISHASGTVAYGELSRDRRTAHYDTSRMFMTKPVPQKHTEAKQRLEKARKLCEASDFNRYDGPANPELVIVCSGSSYLYACDAVSDLGIFERVGILKLGLTWPLPRDFLSKHLATGCPILVAEEVDPFVEAALKEWLYDFWPDRPRPRVYGKQSGHINAVGEMGPDSVARAVAAILGLSSERSDAAGYESLAKQVASGLVDARLLTWCPGCPHRASMWLAKNAFGMEDRDGFVTGDIGCYGMDIFGGGQGLTRTLFCMGAGSGLASGFGQLGRFGFDQPVVAVCGDSTFFHAGIPALINSVHTGANVVMLILDNSATAMTGFQPHPGEPIDAMGQQATAIDIEKLCRSLGCRVEVADPFDIADAERKLRGLIAGGTAEGTTRVMIMRRACALIDFRRSGARYLVEVDPAKCVGQGCGCNWYCMRSFRCPSIHRDRATGKAVIDEATCTGCGVCAAVCPHGAILKVDRNG